MRSPLLLMAASALALGSHAASFHCAMARKELDQLGATCAYGVFSGVHPVGTLARGVH